MSVDRIDPAEPAATFASAYWSADTPVISHRRLEHDYAIPLFGDERRWDLGALGWNPAAGRHSVVLTFDSFSGEWNLRARELAMALLNPVHPVLRDQMLYLQATHAHPKTIRSKLEGLKHFAAWHAANLPDIPITDLHQSHLDNFLTDSKAVGIHFRTRQTIDAIRELHTYEAVLTGGGIPFRPWGDATTIALSGRKSNTELSTPVIPPQVWWPLLRACWQYINVFSHDIFDAAAKWAALDRPQDQRVKVEQPEQAIAAWMTTAGNAVPLHRMTYGRFREGEIHWTLLSLLMSDGHSKQLFAELTRLDVVHRRQRVFGVGRCGVEPRSADRGAIGPEAVVVAAHDGDRTVGHDRVDEGCRRVAAREVVHRPAAPGDPLDLGVRGRVGGDAGDGLLCGLGAAEVALQKLDAAGGGVDVRVLEARAEEGAVEVDDLRLGAAVEVDLGGRDESGDAVAGDGHRVALDRVTGAGEDRSAGEDDICRCHVSHFFVSVSGRFVTVRLVARCCQQC